LTLCNFEACTHGANKCDNCAESYCKEHMEGHMKRAHLLEYVRAERKKAEEKGKEKALAKDRDKIRDQEKELQRLRSHGPKDGKDIAGIAMLVSSIVIALVIMCVLIGSIRVVPAGYKGVIVSSPTGPDRNEINEGWNLDVRYLVSDVELVEYRTQTMDFVGHDQADDEKGSISVSSKDNILINMDFSIVYSIREEKVADLVIENGMNYRHRIIQPIARSIPRDIAAKYNAMEIRGESRAEVEDAIADNITAALAEKDIIVERFAMRDIRLPGMLETAIEEKKVAEQNVLTQEYNLQAEQYVANKSIVRMSAQAAATMINASAIKNATIIRAEGQAQAMSIVMAHLNSTLDNATRDYLTWVYLQALSDPNTNVKFVIVPSDGGVPLLISVEDDADSGP